MTICRIVVGSFAILALLALTSHGCANDGGGDDDGVADTDVDADSDTDADADSDADGGTDTGSDTTDSCDGDCADLMFTACTCALEDPCDWAEDGFCDGFCLEGGVVNEMFDDTADCPDDPCSGLCLEVEWTIYYVPCTCHADDPCEWAGNGICDVQCLDDGVVTEMFDDGQDCNGDAGVDAG